MKKVRTPLTVGTKSKGCREDWNSFYSAMTFGRMVDLILGSISDDFEIDDFDILSRKKLVHNFFDRLKELNVSFVHLFLK